MYIDHKDAMRCQDAAVGVSCPVTITLSRFLEVDSGILDHLELRGLPRQMEYLVPSRHHPLALGTAFASLPGLLGLSTLSTMLLKALLMAGTTAKLLLVAVAQSTTATCLPSFDWVVHTILRSRTLVNIVPFPSYDCR